MSTKRHTYTCIACGTNSDCPHGDSAKKHTHRCCVCGVPFDCYLSKCEVEKAVKINSDGPYCMMCLHLTMAIRLAAVRKLPQVSEAACRALEWASKYVALATPP